MSDRLPWFRCFPSALLGALAGLDPDEGLVYVTALLRIYETGGPVAETARTLARRTGLNERRAGAAQKRLLEAGKVTLTGDGRLDSASTHAEIGWQRERHEEQSAAGRASAAKRQKQVVDKKNDASGKSADADDGKKDQQNQRNDAARVQRPLNHLEEDLDVQTEDEPLSEPRAKARSRSDFPPKAFDRWWERWPHKVGKDAAERKFEQVRKSGRVTFAELMAGIDRYVAAKPIDREFCNPATWLHQGRWTDAPAAHSTHGREQHARAGPARNGHGGRQADFMDLAQHYDRKLREGDDGADPFDLDAAAHAAGGDARNGYLGSPVRQSAGGDLRLPPPSLAGPPRPH